MQTSRRCGKEGKAPTAQMVCIDILTSHFVHFIQKEGPVSRPLLMFLLSRNLRSGRCGGRRRCRLWSPTAKPVEHASARTRNRWGSWRGRRAAAIDNRPRLAVEARQDRQEQAG